MIKGEDRLTKYIGQITHLSERGLLLEAVLNLAILIMKVEELIEILKQEEPTDEHL